VNAVSIKGISKQFKGGTTALEDIALEIEHGEFISLIGPSGCGKSTLLRIIGDLIEPSSGEIQVNGKTARQARRDHDYGIVFQDAVLYEWRTVSRNIALPLELADWDRTRRQKRVDEMLELVELQGFGEHHPWQLSGGMQQRVAIARALACRPAVLLMDEPFSAVDALTRVGLQELLRALWRELRLTVIFVTHDVDEGVYLSTRVVALSRAPAKVAMDLPIDLPQPRDQIATRALPQYLDYRRRLLAQLFADEGLSATEAA
jgi:NitT/TauT family transport system ATP-binding protein